MDNATYTAQRQAIQRKAEALLDLCERYSLDAVPDSMKIMGKFMTSPETQAGFRVQLGGLVALHEVMVMTVLRLSNVDGLSAQQKSDGFIRAIAGALSGFIGEMPPDLKAEFLAKLIDQTLGADAFVKEQLRKKGY